MIELAILGLLDDHELHGYELRKRLGELLGTRLAISFGSLYPALNRLEKAGHVKAVTQLAAPDEGRPSPMSGSLTGELAAFSARRRRAGGGAKPGGRGKKVYGVTNGGRQRLRELITDPDVSDDRAFAVRVAFCQHVERAQRVELFERRRAELARRRDDRRRAGRSAGRVDTYLRALLEHDDQALAADLAWLDRLIAAERDGPATEPAAPSISPTTPTDSGVGSHPDPGGHT